MSRLFAGRVAASLLAASAAFAMAAAPAGAVTAGADLEVSARVVGTYVGSNDLAAVQAAVNRIATTRITPGTGTGHADKVFMDTRTIAASSSENLDLAGGLTDAFGATITCAKVKALYVKAAAGNTNNVQVGGAASNTFTGPFADATDILSIPPGGVLLLVHPGAGWTVTAGTGDILKVANSSSGTGGDYDIIAVCATA